MYDPIARALKRRPFLLLDGALATELEYRGADLRDPLWSAKILIENPGLIRAVHFDYFAAGADVATSATYQATFEAFARRGLSHDEAARLMRAAISLARAARDEFWAEPANRTGRLRPLIAASIGPYGAMLADGSEYRGEYAIDDEALARFHRPRLALLADAGADLIAFETIPCLREAKVLAHALREFPGVCAWMSFSCRDGSHNSTGEDIGDCVAQLAGFEQIVAIGVNCTAPVHVGPLLHEMRLATSKPLVAYPNSGEHYDAGRKLWEGSADCGHFAGLAKGWYAAGARLIGGCCRTRPSDIQQIARELSA